MNKDAHLIFEAYALHGLAQGKSVEDIAKKHGVEVSVIEHQIEMGAKVEHEHTQDEATAKKIATDHVFEDPEYYTKLKQMESKDKPVAEAIAAIPAMVGLVARSAAAEAGAGLAGRLAAQMGAQHVAKKMFSDTEEAAEDKPKEKLTYTYEVATAYLPRDIDVSTREGQDKVLSLAYDELVKAYTGKYKNPRLAARNTFDEDFPMEVLSQYEYYQKNGFPGEEKKDDSEFKEQMPDSREEYSAQEYAQDMEAEPASQKVRTEDEESKREVSNERNWVDSFYKTFGPGYKEELEKSGIDPYEHYVDYYGRLYDDEVIRKYTSIYNKKHPEYPVNADKLLMVMHIKRQKPLEGHKHPGK